MKRNREAQAILSVGRTLPQASGIAAPASGIRQNTLTADPGPVGESPALQGGSVTPEPKLRHAGEADETALPKSLRERYDDIRLLGEGGMGTVYRGRDVRLGRPVALKLLRRADPVLALRLLQEAKAQARVQHDLVCRVYEAGEADGAPFIAMQYIDGEPLDRAKTRMTLEQKVKVVREVCSALHEAHRLGLVHRDIKPGNILVETGEDGAFKPYVVDFGIARDASAQGYTMTGAVLGTPAFMAPEQARGEVHSLDRRTDVYSLGSTLYDLLAGRPPFVTDQPWKLLAMVAEEEAPALRAAMKQVPADLETIVMKCLQRQPSHRYESARALGEDLQRYLDGEPIQARRSAIGYVLWRKASKHKWAVLLGSAVIVATAISVGAWAKARRDAEAQVVLARELGEDVKEMELFLRSAYELPLHDVERERDVVRARLGEIERTMDGAGKVARGPGHYALGRGYLALGDPQKAREHLEKALAGGYRSAELEYALGQALGELYRTALEDTKRIQNKEARQAKVREIENSLRDPALAHLGAAAGAAVESPAYAEGLIAFHGGKYEEALAKAKEAFEKAPWLYEAKKLEADAHFALGSQYRLDGHFDWDKMMVHFGPAAEAYRAAADMARSDPDVHRAECQAWMRIGEAAGARVDQEIESFAKADDACARAIRASSRDVRAHIQLGYTYAMRAFAHAARFAPSHDPGKLARDAVALGEEAVRVSPGDIMAHWTLALASVAAASYAAFSGRDGRVSARRSVDAAMEAVRLEPQVAHLELKLAQALSLHMIFDLWWGRDVTPAMERALEVTERLIALDPDYAFGWTIKACIHLFMLRAVVECGQLPYEQMRHTLVAAEKAERLSPGWWLVYQLKAESLMLTALHEISAGKDPRLSAEQARQEAEKLKGYNRTLYDEISGAIYYGEALYALQSGADPRTRLGNARNAFLQMADACPWALDTAIWRARVEILAIRWVMQKRKAQAALFDAAFAPLRPFLSEERVNPHLYQALAEIHALRSQWLLRSGKRPADDIAQGLAMADKALSINPRMATAFAAKATLKLVEARAAPDRSTRAQAAVRAQEAFKAAFQNNPLLEREHGPGLREAERLR